MVERHPYKTAVEDEKESLTYELLWQQAKELSLQLKSGDSHYVLIQEARSCRLLVRLLAVWLAGHAPLMLDPQTPTKRWEEVLQQVKPLAFFQREGVVVYDQDLSSAQGVEYLVATSGSTGRPKMVMVGDGGLVPMLRSQIEAFQVGSESTVLWMLSPGFDASFSDIGTALLSGAKLLCGTPGIARELLGVLREQAVTHLDIPPSLLARFQPGEFPPSLRCLVVGGEPSRAETLRAWSKFHRLVAVYGPSEATVCASLSVVDEQWDRAYIGRPLPGVEFDTEGEQLLIGGPQVALGYLGEESAAFHARAGKTWYRSGDLVGPISHPRHGLEFKGRLDRQVKLRGQRLELQEIEARASEILSHGDVAVEFKEGRLRLYWRRGSDPVSEEFQLRRALSQVLPPTFMPSRFVSLVEFPRGASGKVDRQALPEIDYEGDLDSLQLISLFLDLERQGALSTDFLGRQAESLARSLSPPRVSSKPPRPRLLVTGLQGNLGSALGPLLQEDFEVWALSRSQAGPRTLRGDLALPRFGLDPEAWEFLCAEVDQVLHLAAGVDLSKSYRELKAVNATCLVDLSSPACPLHLASTMAVTLSAVPASLEKQSGESLVYGGYAQSKWVADRALELAAFPGLTFRYGHLLGAPGADLLATVIGGLRDLGCGPRVRRNKTLFFDITPMDWAARKTAGYLRQGTGSRTLLYLRPGLQAHFQDLAEIMLSRGSIEQVENEDFFALTPPTQSAALALRALWKCRPRPREFRPDFDLFLLGNSGLAFESTELAKSYLESYITAVLEAELSIPSAHGA